MKHTFKSAALFVAMLASSLASTEADASTIPSINVSSLGSNVYQIDFDPITFVTTSGTSGGYGFIVEDAFLSNASSTTFASGGSFNVQIIRSGSEVFNAATSATGFPRGTYGDAVSAGDQNDLVAGIGGSSGFPGGVSTFSFQTGDTVTFSATNLQFTSSDPLPSLFSGTRDAFLIDNFRNAGYGSTEVALNVTDPTAPIPLPAALPLLLAGLGALGLLRRRV